MMCTRLIKLFGLSMALALVALAVGESTQIGLAQGGKTLTVCASDCNFAKIQEAIDAASSGDTIQVQPGTYPENLAIREKQGLTLEGVVTLVRGGVTVDGSAGIAEKKAAILVEKSQAITIRSFRVINSRRGLEANDTQMLLVTDSRFESNLRQSILLLRSQGELRSVLVRDTQKDQDGGGGIGIQVADSQFTITDATVSGSADQGIVGQGSTRESGSTLAIEKSSIRDNASRGVGLFGTTRATITETSIAENVGGIFALDSSEATITNSQIADTKADAQGRSGDGIYVTGTSKLTITVSTITGSATRGILLDTNGQATIQNSTISNNVAHGIGIGLDGTPNENIAVQISNNQIQNNRRCGVKTDTDTGIAITGRDTTISGNPQGNLCGTTSKFPAGFGGGK